MMRLSQMPMPSLEPTSEIEMPSPPLVGSSQAHELPEYQADGLLDDAYMDGAAQDVAPIARAPLRLHCGIEPLDAYAGRWHYGGANASVEAAWLADTKTVPGFPIGSALEIVGPPGCGKTLWALQMAMAERMQHVWHAMQAYVDEVGPPGSLHRPAHVIDTLRQALESEVEPWSAQVVLVDTEGSLALTRLAAMTMHHMPHDAAQRMHKFAEAAGLHVTSSDVTDALRVCLPRTILRGIHLVRTTTLGQLVAFLGMAANSARLKMPGLPPRTSLLIVDTLSFLTSVHSLPVHASREQRRTRDDTIRYIVRCLTTLRDSQLPEHDRMSVVVTMQMATKLINTETARDAALVPALSIAPTSSMRRALVDASAVDWGPSVLGQSAWRILLGYEGLGPYRYAWIALLTHRRLSVQAKPDASWATDTHDDTCPPRVMIELQVRTTTANTDTWARACIITSFPRYRELRVIPRHTY